MKILIWSDPGAHIELENISEDIGEERNQAGEYPDIVARVEELSGQPTPKSNTGRWNKSQN